MAYRPEGQRQLAIHLWTLAKRVEEEISEVIDSLEQQSDENAQKIRAHLAGVVSVVGIELGYSQLEDMGIVFAREVARWFGQTRKGIVKDDQETWFLIDDGAFVPIAK